MPDIAKACFLQDEASQLLALSDAVSSANGPAIAEAFDAVARTKGLARIAEDAGVSLGDLHRALADPMRPDLGFLMKVLDALEAR